MFLLLYGQDTYRIAKKADAIWKRYQEVSPQGFRSYRWEKSLFDLDTVKDAIATRSMFREKKFLLFKNALRHAALGQLIESYRDHLISDKDTIVVFIEEEDIPRKDANPLFQMLLQHAALTQRFSLLEGAELARWIQKAAERHGVRIEDAAVQILQRESGNNLWQLDNELQKLVAFKGYQGTVTGKDVRELVAGSLEANIFHMLEALAKGDKKQTIELMRIHAARGDSFPYIFSMVLMHFRNLLLIRDLQEHGLQKQDIAKQMKMHPYAFSKAYAAASRFSAEKLLDIYRQLFQIDSKTKLGQEELGQALELFALRL